MHNNLPPDPKYDISLPLDVLYDLVLDVRERCAHLALCTVGYGHIGDGSYTYIKNGGDMCVCVSLCKVTSI